MDVQWLPRQNYTPNLDIYALFALFWISKVYFFLSAFKPGQHEDRQTICTSRAPRLTSETKHLLTMSVALFANAVSLPIVSRRRVTRERGSVRCSAKKEGDPSARFVT